jgi:hypothetical protein
VTTQLSSAWRTAVPVFWLSVKFDSLVLQAAVGVDGRGGVALVVGLEKLDDILPYAGEGHGPREGVHHPAVYILRIHDQAAAALYTSAHSLGDLLEIGGAVAGGGEIVQKVNGIEASRVLDDELAGDHGLGVAYERFHRLGLTVGRG